MGLNNIKYNQFVMLKSPVWQEVFWRLENFSFSFGMTLDITIGCFMKNINWTIGVLLFFTTFSAHAISGYQCIIERVFTAEAGPNPTLKTNERNFIGKQFSVDRATGHMVGVLKNFYVTEPQVIDHGSNENSYKVISVMRKKDGAGKGSNVYALTINEFSETLKMPFVFLENDVVYFGTCEHY
jgi:hypothetical protein